VLVEHQRWHLDKQVEMVVTVLSAILLMMLSQGVVVMVVVVNSQLSLEPVALGAVLAH
jgi:hypothetical protein